MNQSQPPLQQSVHFESDRFFELSMDLLCIAGSDGYFKRLNPAWESTLGFSREELCATPFIEFIHPDDRIRTQEVMGQLAQGQSVTNFENRYRCKDGSYRWLCWITPGLDRETTLLYAAARDITERKRMEESLRQANDELERRGARRTEALVAANEALRVADSWQRALIEAIQGIVWECDARTWRFTFVSHQAELLLGYPVRRWLDEPDFWAAHIHPDDRAWVKDYCLNAKNTQRKYAFEYRMIAADGRAVWLQDIVTVEAGEQGPILLRGIMVDITQRKEAEEALRQSEAFVSSVIDHLPDMVFVKEAASLRFVRLNKAGEALLGYSHRELLGKNDYDFFPPEEADSFTAADRAVLDSGRLLDIPEEPIQTKQQGLRYLHTKKIPLCGPDGAPQFLLGISEDITERKRTEEALRASEERCSSLVAQATDIIYTANMEGRFTFVNAAACSIMQYGEQELLGRHYLDLVRPDRCESLQSFYKWQVAEQIPTTYCEFPALTKQGDELWLGQHVRLRLVDGQMTGIEAIARDITARKRVEEALHESEQRLRHAVEEREQLSQDLHDNIIQSVYAIGMGLEECRHLVRENPSEGDKKLEQAIAGLNRVITDVRNYLVWEKPEEITPRQFPAKLAELVVMMESVEGLRFSLDVDPAAVQRLTSAAASHLLRIVHEAMSNSLRHSKSRSGLVSLRTEDRHIRLEVMDYGVGFDPARAASGGQGMGNMAARAQKLGARFQVVSMPGQGTRILIELPMEEDHAARSR